MFFYFWYLLKFFSSDLCNLKTKGDILMDQVKVLDLSIKQYEFIEKAPKEMLGKCNIIFNAVYEKLLNS